MRGLSALAVETTAARPAPALAATILLIAFFGWLALLALYARVGTPRPERLRKLLHTGSGLLTLSFPWLFDEAWPVVLLCGVAAAVLLGVKRLPGLRARFGPVVNGVDRDTFGEVYFPLSVAVLFVLAEGQSRWATTLFTIPMLVLTLADAVSALVGARYGLHRYAGSAKSLEGSVAFFVVALLSVHVPCSSGPMSGGSKRC